MRWLLLLLLSILYDSSNERLCSIDIYSPSRSITSSVFVKGRYSSPVPIQLLLSLCLFYSENWQLSRHRDTMKNSTEPVKTRRRRRRRFCQIFLRVYSIQWKIELDCLLSVAIDKHSLLYTIILCRIRAKLLTPTIEQNEMPREREREREAERASVALIIHPIDYRSSWRHISACLILHAIVNSSFLFPSSLVISLYSQRRGRPMPKALRLNAHCHAWCCVLLKILLAAHVLVQFDLPKIDHYHHRRHIWASGCVNGDDQIISAYSFLRTHGDERMSNASRYLTLSLLFLVLSSDSHTCTSPPIERRLYYMLDRFHHFSHNCSRVVYSDERSTGQMIYILVRRKKYCKCYFKVREMNGMETGAHMCTCDDKYESDNLTAAPDFLWAVALGRAKKDNERDRDIHISRRSDRFSPLHLLLAVLDQFVSLKFARAQWQSIQPLARNKSSSSDTKMCICARTH